MVDGGKGRQIRRFLRGVPREKVLDVGCGTGNWAGTATRAYVGVDVSPEFVEAARRKHAGDAGKQFLLLDATREAVDGDFDLVQLVSVLHHLSDEDVRRLLHRVVPRLRRLFVLDLYPVPWNPVSRLLYAADRGDFIRTPEEQKRLILEHPALRLVRQDDYFAPTGLYRHTLFLFEHPGSEADTAISG